ncbi:MAG: PIN domain-containing protein [Methylocystaceae bacterium]|jgi:tRNA(fMet)-specific endonuclease VapC|nr:PIN domain-containing protein [Methylocystaceae bacterium]NBT96540.1 PIN domain-containing protein [Methylocystaceae bacterium]
MTRYLLDASVSFALLGGEQTVLGRLAQLETQQVALSAIAWSEALAAASQDRRLKENIDLCRQNLDILPFHRASAEAYGALLEAVVPKRRRILDRMVAAQALEAGLTLVTLTPEIFEDIQGLTILNWA